MALPLALTTLAVETASCNYAQNHPGLVGIAVVALVGGAAEMVSAFSGAQEQAGSERGHRARERRPDCTVHCPCSRSCQLPDRPDRDGPSVLARRSGDDAGCQRVPRLW